MKKRQYKRFGAKYVIQNLLLVIPLAALFIVAWSRWEALDMTFWVCITLFVIGIAAGLIWEVRRLKTFHCPQCGKPIREPTIADRKAGDPIDYSCQRCDIEWITGLVEPEID